jgi:hypothetical protein
MTNRTVSSGHTSVGLTEGNGNNLYVYGTAVSTTDSSGCDNIVLSGGTASFATVSNGGYGYLSGGTCRNDLVRSDLLGNDLLRNNL